jgi:hypothetical protein
LVISSSLPNLINGVSQQDPKIRLASQGEVQDNGTSSPADGLGKRQPTDHIAQLTHAEATYWPHVHFINRDDDERYVVVIQGGRPKVFDLNGREFPVSSTLVEFAYLECDKPAHDLECLTLADTTFILNKTVTTSMQDTRTEDRGDEAIVWVKAGNYASNYSVVVNGQTFNYTTSGTDVNTIATDRIADLLAKQIKGTLPSSEWTVIHRPGDSSFYIHRKDHASFSIDVFDSQSSRSLGLIKTTVQRFSDLPGVARNEMVVKIVGDADSESDDYYVKFITNDDSDFGSGLWVETVAPNVPFEFDQRTLPHILTREQDIDGSVTGQPGTIFFRFQKAPFEGRVVGDEASNADPSFVGQKISSLFLYRNRLGFLSGPNVSMSRVGEYFSFLRGTVQRLEDSDRIDVSSIRGISTLRHAAPFSDSLVLFAEKYQMSLKGGDLLTPKTVSITEAMAYDSEHLCKPLASENQLYFAYRSGDYAGLRELYVSGNTAQFESNQITAHVPRYLSGDAWHMVSSSVESSMVVLTNADRQYAYLYQWRYNGQEKIQSSWSRFDFGPDVVVQGCEFIGSTLYLVIQRECGQYLEAIDFSRRADPNCNYTTLLDRRITDEQALDITYNPFRDQTTITLPYKASTTPMVVTRATTDEEWKPGVVLPVVRMVDCDPPPVVPPPPPDVPSVSVIATDPDAKENPVDVGVFTITRTGSLASAMNVNIGYTGTATNTTDYTASPSGTTLTIPAGSASIAVTITPINDAAVEGTETVNLSILPASAGEYIIGTPPAATVYIVDDEDTSGGIPCTNTDVTKFSVNFSGITNHSGNRTVDGAPWVATGTLGSYCDPTASGARSIGMDLVFGGTSHDTTTSIIITGGSPQQLVVFQPGSTGINTDWFRGNLPSDWATRNGPYTISSLLTTSTGDGPIGTGGTCTINPCGCLTGTPLGVPNAPTTLVATGGTNQITLTWTDNSTNETGFKVERSANGTTGWTQIATTFQNIATYINTGLPNGTKYYYRVRAYNSTGDSAYSNVANATTAGATGAGNTQIITYNTGENRTQALCSFSDTKWTVDGLSAKRCYIPASPNWYQNDGSASWISYDATTQDIIEASDTIRSFATQVLVGGDVDLTTMTIGGDFTVDDTLLDILVNGVSTGISYTSAIAWTDLHPFTLSPSLFQHGVNSIVFKVKNVGVSALNNPTGLFVRWTTTVVAGRPDITEAEANALTTFSRDYRTEQEAGTSVMEDPCLCKHRIVLTGDLRDKALWIGMPYRFLYRFSQQVVRGPTQGGSIAAVTSGRLQLRSMRVNFARTGYFRAEVTPLYRNTNTYAYSGREVGVPVTRIGDVPIATSSLRFAVNSKSEQCIIDLVNDDFLPSWFTSAEWEGDYYDRSRRI